MSLFALDPANTARGCRACCHSDDRVVPHQPHWTFARSDGQHAARRPDARRDRWSRTHADHNAGSDTMQQNAAPSRLSLFALDPANTARGSWLVVPVAIQTTGWFHSPTAWTFTRSDGRHGAQLPDARRDRWCCAHADHSAESDTMQLTAAHNWPTEPQQTRSPLHQHEEQYSNRRRGNPPAMPLLCLEPVPRASAKADSNPVRWKWLNSVECLACARSDRTSTT